MAREFVTYLAHHWIEIGQVLVAAVGLFFIYRQLREVHEDVEAQGRNIQAQTLGHIYDHYFKVCHLFVARPYLRPYFYDAQSLAAFDHTVEAQLRRSEVKAVCELITGLLEHAAIQRPNIPPQSWEDCWLPFLKEMYRKSPALEEFYWNHRHFYAADFRHEVETVLGREEPALAGGENAEV